MTSRTKALAKPETNGEVVYIDPSKLTLGDLEDFEERTGMQLQEAFADETRVSAKAMITMLWIVRRAENPESTYEDARRIPFSELQGKRLEFSETPTGAATG